MFLLKKPLVKMMKANILLASNVGKCFSGVKTISQLQQMRNKDYKELRKTAIEQYNTKISKENEIYKQTIKQMKKTRDIDPIQEAEDKIDLEIDRYKHKIESFHRDLKKKLKEIDQQQKTNTVKLYLFDHLKQNQTKVQNTSSQQSNSFYIPNRFILKKMYLCDKKLAKNSSPKQQLLLAGVQSQQQHCLFLAKLMEQFNIKNVVTMVPPDLPFFLKTEDSFLGEWRKFLQDNNYAKKVKFYVNPKPTTLQQICLHSHHSPLVRSAMSRSRAFLNTHYFMLQQNEVNGEFEPQPLLTGLCKQSVQKVYMGGYPVFEQRKMLADNMTLIKLRALFQEHLKNVRQMRFNFSAQWLFPKQVLRKKLSHFLGVARAVTEKEQGRTLLICPAEIAELLGIQWQLGNKQNNLRFNHQDGKYYLNLQNLSEGVGEQTFMEFIQKLVILDLIIQPVITKYFIRYKSFPFLCHHTIGGKENIGKVFIIWMHFYRIYYDLLNEKRLASDHQKKMKQQYFSKLDNPTNL